MTEDTSPEFAMLAGLKNAVGNKCPECGEENVGNAVKCEKCGAVLVDEEAEKPMISFVQEEGIKVSDMADAEVAKIPLNKSQNLILLEGLLDKAQEGTLTMEEYQAGVNKVLNTAQEGLELYISDVVKEKIRKLDSNTQRIFEEAAKQFQYFYDGCRKMLQYDGRPDITVAVDGFEMIEDALINMDKLHDNVIKAYQTAKEEEKEQEDKLQLLQDKAAYEKEKGYLA